MRVPTDMRNVSGDAIDGKSAAFSFGAVASHRCLLLAQSGHSDTLNQCLLLGGKADIDRTSPMSTYDP